MCTTYAEAHGGKKVHGTGVRGVIKCCVCWVSKLGPLKEKAKCS